MSEILVVKTRLNPNTGEEGIIIGAFDLTKEVEAKDFAKAFKADIVKVVMQPEKMSIDYVFDSSLEFQDMQWHIAEENNTLCKVVLQKPDAVWKPVRKLMSDNNYTYNPRTCPKCIDLHKKSKSN